MRIKLHLNNARGAYLVKESFDGCHGCAFMDSSHRVCDSIGDYLVSAHYDLKVDCTETLGGCKMPMKILVKDTPEGIMSYLIGKESGDYE